MKQKNQDYIIAPYGTKFQGADAKGLKTDLLGIRASWKFVFSRGKELYESTSIFAKLGLIIYVMPLFSLIIYLIQS